MREGAPVRGKTTGAPLGRRPACRVVTAGGPPRAPHRAIFDEITGLLSSDRGILTAHVIQAAFSLPFIRCCPSHLRQPPHRARPVTSLPGTWLRRPRLQAPHPAPSAKRP